MCRISIIFCRSQFKDPANQVINIDVIQFFELKIPFEGRAGCIEYRKHIGV
jgi:hypothetical protein